MIMKYDIEYLETVKRINTITIEVESEEQGEKIADELCKKAAEYNHPDDIFFGLEEMGVKVVGKCDGAEECEYEID